MVSETLLASGAVGRCIVWGSARNKPPDERDWWEKVFVEMIVLGAN